MTILSYLIARLGDLVNLLADAAIWAWDSTLPLDWLGDIFYELHWLVLNIVSWIYGFDDWLMAISYKVEDILDWDAVQDLLLDWLPHLRHMHDWWYDWVYWVGRQITEWWQTAISEVEDLISAAIQGFRDLVNDLDSWLSNLQSSWNNFWVSILPNLADWTGVDDLIRTWFTNFTPFWEDWLDWKDSVAEFFTDPLQWLYDKMDEWFERFW